MLAIVIPYYKIDFFSETLHCLVNQTNKQFHVYIGNDGSTDNPDDIIATCVSKINITYKKFDNNLGGKSLVKHWNRCLEMINDEKWVVILGDDDLLDKNCVEEFYNNLKDIEDRRINVVRFASIIINSKSEIISKKYQHPKLETSVDFFERKQKGGSRSSLSEYVFRKENLVLRDFPLAWHTDDLAILQCSEYKNIFTINNAIASFRHSNQNITGRITDLDIKNKSSFQFYYYLNRFQNTNFNRAQRLVLVKKLNKTVVNSKKEVFNMMRVKLMYLSRFQLLNLVKLEVLLIKSIFNKFKV